MFLWHKKTQRWGLRAHRDQASGSVPCTLQLPSDSIVKLGGAKSASLSGSRIAVCPAAVLP
jgi:hypothetical protein